MPYFNQAINLNFRRMNISSLAIYFILPVSVLYGLDFCPEPELNLKTPLPQVEHAFRHIEGIFVETNAEGKVENGLLLLQFNRAKYWDSAVLSVSNAEIEAVSYVFDENPLLSSNEVQNVLFSLTTRYGRPDDSFFLNTFDNEGAVYSPAYGWNSRHGYIVFAHGHFYETPHGTPISCQMTVMGGRQDLSKHFDLRVDAAAECERAAKLAATDTDPMALTKANERLWRTPLMLAALNCDLAEVETLVENGADVAKMDKTGFTVIDILKEQLRRLEAIQPEAKADYASRLLKSGFLEKDVRSLLRIQEAAARDLPKDEQHIEAMRKILEFLERHTGDPSP